MELCNWKHGLPAPEERVWSHVIREMDYRFWQSDSNPLPPMDDAYEALLSAKSRYGDICKTYGIEQDSDTDKAHNAAKSEADILNTEEYLARHLKDGSTAAQAKIGKRLGAIISLFPYDRICPLIRKAVNTATGL